MGILLRWLGAFLLLAAIFNPTQWNYVTWARTGWADQMPLIIFTGLILAVITMVYLVATMRSIGILGALIIAAIFAAGLWVLTDWGLLGLANNALARDRGPVPDPRHRHVLVDPAPAAVRPADHG
jgi:Family of unknown function (DUF6524)